MNSLLYNNSRYQEMARNQVGFIFKGSTMGASKLENFLFRRLELNLYDNYLNNCQYDHLMKWNSNISDQQMDDRTTQPKVIFPLPEITTGIINGLLTSEESRLILSLDKVSEQDNFDEFLEQIQLWNHLAYLIPSLLCNGSAFLKLWTTSTGKIQMKFFNSKYCWPVFDEDQELESIVIRYIYDTGELNERGEKIFKWSQQKLTKTEDILYNEPIFQPEVNEIPQFNIVTKQAHNCNFVQGVWLTTSYFDAIPDGHSYIKSTISFLDSLNYRLSKEDSALYYNLFPLLNAFGMNIDDVVDDAKEVQGKVKDGYMKGMNILATDTPADKASMGFLESGMTGLQLSEAFHIRMLQLMQYSLSSVLLDPEKLAGYAQSAKSMEALHRPVIQYVKKIRPQIKKSVCDILYKLEMLCNKYNTEYKIPVGTTKVAKKKWGLIFEDTPADIATKVQYATSATMAKIISRKTATEHLAQSFGITNVEEELGQINEEKAEEFEDQQLMQNMGQPTGVNNAPTQKRRKYKVKRKRRTRVRRYRGPLKSKLDEIALAGSIGAGAFAGSQYIALRRDLFKEYTKNAWKVSGKPFSQKGYRKWIKKYLEHINKLRTSPHKYKRGMALFRDLQHFNPRFITKDSRKLINKKRVNDLLKLNKSTFRKLVPKRSLLFVAGLGTAATLPALAYKLQGKKNWKRSIKESATQIAGPTIAIAGAYGLFKVKRYARLKKLI